MTYLTCFLEHIAGAAKRASRPLQPIPGGPGTRRHLHGGSDIARDPELDRRLPRSLRRDGWWLES